MVHQITISQDFQLGRTEVTKAQWQAVMGTTPWACQLDVLDDPDSPAVYISWNDAQAFITALNGLTGETFRLPTEAEWEYACRAGTVTNFYFGDSAASISNYAWWYGNGAGVGERYAHLVAQKLPNNFGLYDMHGNVFEWCNDWYDRFYYVSSPSTDPTGPGSGSSRVARGGSVDNNPLTCSSYARFGFAPAATGYTSGFRLAK